MNYYTEILPKYIPYFITGTVTTIVLALITVVAGSLIGSLISMLRISDSKGCSTIAKVYISVIRGTPLIVQLLIGFSIISKAINFSDTVIMGVDMQRFIPCIIVLGMNSGAYVAELIRAGIQAVDKGQLEAARSLGMTKGVAMRKIVLPQAIKNILPAIGSEFVSVIKETAIIQYLGVSDLMYNTGTVITSTYVILPNYYIAALIYFVLTFVTSGLVNRLEKNLNSTTKRGPLGKRPTFA
ncbi:MAG: amino acid ABC transporter permease [Filifactoraceae bacterium]